MPLLRDRFSDEYWAEFTRLIGFMDSRELGEAGARYAEAYAPPRFQAPARKVAAHSGGGGVTSLFAAHRLALSHASAASRRDVREDWPTPTSFEPRGHWAWFESKLSSFMQFGVGSARPELDEEHVGTAQVAIHAPPDWYGRGVAFLTDRTLRVGFTEPAPLFSRHEPRFRVSVPIDSVRELAVQPRDESARGLGLIRVLFMTPRSPAEGPYGGFLMEFDGGADSLALVRELRGRWLDAVPGSDAPGFEKWLKPM